MNAPNARPGQIDLTDPVATRRGARVIGAGILFGAVAFAVVVNSLAKGESTPNPATEHALYTPFVIIAGVLVFLTTIIGTRMHSMTGTLAERTRKTLVAQTVSLALSEGAAFLGLILVMMTRSWDVALPAALGFAGVVTSIIRGEFRFSALVEERHAVEEGGGHR